jgi:hypothetical protein
VEKEMTKFRDFESAREFVRKLNLKNFTEWKLYCKSGNKPDDIHSNPNRSYKKNFKGYGDWLGTGTVATQDKIFLPFTEAREFARVLNLKSKTEWEEYYKSGNKPDDIPAAPNQTYKKDFKGWGDFLGTGTVATFNRQYRSFTEAREFARVLNLNNFKDWEEYCKSGNKPDDIPTNPSRTYKNEYQGHGDWLGTGRIANFNIQYRSFTEAREFVRSLGLKNKKEWEKFCALGNKPDDIPANPNQTYKKDFKGVGDWLGTGTVATQDKTYRSFTEAREFVRSLNLNNFKEWMEYCASGDKPNDIPSNPNGTYKKDFKGFGDWLGTGRIANVNRIYRSFTEAREFVRSLGLKNYSDWEEYCKSGDKPDDIPSAPWVVYKKWKKK